MLSLYKLEIFSAVIEAGSFSGAAERLYLTQSAISQHVQDLEASLGTRLFERGPRGVRLTSAGERLQDYTRCILNLLAEAENAVTDVANLGNGQLRLGATPGAGSYLLPEWMGSFRRRYPKLTISLITGTTGEVAAAVQGRSLDLGLVEGELTDAPALDRLLLQDVQQWVVVAANHPWRERESIELATLAGEPIVARPPNTQSRIWLNRLLEEHGISPRIAAEFDNPEAIKQAVVAGMGIAILPDYVIRRERELGLLHPLAVSDAHLGRGLKLIWDRRRPLNPVARAFLAHLTDQFPALYSLVGRLPQEPHRLIPPAPSDALESCQQGQSTLEQTLP